MTVCQDIAIILKKTLYQDKKIIVSALTKTQGLVSFSALLGKKQHHVLGILELGNIVDLELKESKETFYFHDAKVLFSPISLRSHLNDLKLLYELLHTLSFQQAYGMPSPLFFDFLKNALITLDTHPLKSDLCSFIYLKYLQAEGILDKPPHLDMEINKLLEIRKFEALFPLSKALVTYIQSRLKATS